MPGTGFDHLVLLVADAERSLGFWVGTLGLEPERVEEWRAGQVFFPSVRIDATTVIDLLETPPDGRNTDHLCLVVDEDPHAMATRLGLDVHDSGRRWGAQGEAESVYVRDPDGYVVELRRYG